MGNGITAHDFRSQLSALGYKGLEDKIIVVPADHFWQATTKADLDWPDAGGIVLRRILQQEEIPVHVLENGRSESRFSEPELTTVGVLAFISLQVIRFC